MRATKIVIRLRGRTDCFIFLGRTCQKADVAQGAHILMNSHAFCSVQNYMPISCRVSTTPGNTKHKKILLKYMLISLCVSLCARANVLVLVIKRVNSFFESLTSYERRSMLYQQR